MNTKIIHLISFVALLLLFVNCQNTAPHTQTQEKGIDANLDKSAEFIKVAIKEAYKHDQIPRGMHADGSIKFCNNGFDWTEGFFPGLCWDLYSYTKDEEFKKAAEFFQAKFEDHKLRTTNHDLGFVFNDSYGKGYRLSKNEAYKDVLIEASNSLIQRFNPTVGCIKSWDVERGWQSKRGWKYPVIIDNMMNLEMLFEASLITGDKKYYDIAVKHANTTIDNHFRDDNSTFHVVDYDPETGEVRNKHTAQGYAHQSAWSRGQGWGIYGYTLCYRYTKDPVYLEYAEKIANYLLNHKNLPEDKVPYWDFNAPLIPNEPRDVSAAAIIASALIELDGYSEKDYLSPAKQMLASLSTEKYMTGGKDNILILGHSVGSIPHGGEVDVPIVYADYYYVQALLRLKELGVKNL